MKKHFLLSIIVLVFFAAYNTAWGNDTFKIGIFDLQRCIEKSKKGNQYFQLLRKKGEGYQKQLDKKQKEILKTKEEFEKQITLLSPDAKEEKKREVERMVKDFEYLYKDINKKMGRERQQEERKILKELIMIIQKVGAEGNYTLIMEKADGGAIYVSSTIDITDKVIEAYDQTTEETE